MITGAFEEQRAGTARRFLHVLNGEATRGKLQQSSVPGTFAIWADVLHDGPCRLGSSDEWRHMRARHLASQGFLTENDILAEYARWDAQLAAFREYDEVVFWFEHDLFDQLLLVRHLHWLCNVNDVRRRFSLICIGTFPGVPDFAGLGQLLPDQLASLLDMRQPLSARQLESGSQAWQAFCSPDPTSLVALLHGDATGPLPFLAGALRRFIEDYPDRVSGLARSERQILQVIDAGATAPGEAFTATQKLEERVFMGDWTYWTIVRRLATARTPLLQIQAERSAPGTLPGGTLRLTEAGRDVLHGGADHIALNGIDRWMGGVHLTDGRWRWTGETVQDVNRLR